MMANAKRKNGAGWALTKGSVVVHVADRAVRCRAVDVPLDFCAGDAGVLPDPAKAVDPRFKLKKSGTVPPGIMAGLGAVPKKTRLMIRF